MCPGMKWSLNSIKNQVSNYKFTLISDSQLNFDPIRKLNLIIFLSLPAFIVDMTKKND